MPKIQQPDRDRSVGPTCSQAETRKLVNPTAQAARVAGFWHPALGANASPEVTRLFCRLPLVTLLHGPEAIHLGVRMRLSVRSIREGRRSQGGLP